MYEALTPHIDMIDNQIRELEIRGKQIRLIGIGSLWSYNSKTEILNEISEEENTIVLMHNPDSTLEFPNTFADLAVAGHTHGGQIRIPFIYKNAIPTRANFDSGWYDIFGMQLFITTGTGEVGLPMRLFVPPSIDLIEFRVD